MFSCCRYPGVGGSIPPWEMSYLLPLLPTGVYCLVAGLAMQFCCNFCVYVLRSFFEYAYIYIYITYVWAVFKCSGKRRAELA